MDNKAVCAYKEYIIMYFFFCIYLNDTVEKKSQINNK